MDFIDHLSLDKKVVGDIRRTKEGWVVANPRVARTGIQLYGGREVGKPEMNVVRVYRSEDEVMKKESLRSFVYRPITDDHPSVPVTSKNIKDHFAGIAGDEVARDGEFIRVPMTLMDQGLIDKFDAGKVELSVGYSCDLDWGEGTTPDGQKYDAKQKDIMVNHIAVVDQARGGRKLRIGDEKSPLLLADGESQKLEPLVDWYVADGKTAGATEDHHNTGEMVMKVITLDGVSVQVADDTAASVIQRFEAQSVKNFNDMKSSLEAQVVKLTADAAAAEAKRKEEKEEEEKKFKAKDAECVALTAKLADADAKVKPEALALMVADRTATISKCRMILGDKAPKEIETMDTSALQKIVVDAKLGDKAKDYDAGQIKIAFDTLTSDMKVTQNTPGTRPLADALQHTSVNTVDYQKQYDDRIRNAWKNPAGATQ